MPGQEMSEEAWSTGYVRCLGVRLAGDMIDDIDERGEPVQGDSILLLMNAHYEPIPFTLPVRYAGQEWERVLDTADPHGESVSRPAGEPYALQGRSMVVLRTQPPPQEEMQSAAAAAGIEH
jgi:isoamylase